MTSEQDKKKTFTSALMGMLFFVTILHGNLFAHAIVGWRNDGTGVYPLASPPATLSLDNIKWRTPLLKASMSAPIIVDNKVFVTTDKTKALQNKAQTVLVCIDRSTGDVLWERPILVKDALTTAQREKAQADEAKVKDLAERYQTNIMLVRKYRGKNKRKTPADEAAWIKAQKTWHVLEKERLDYIDYVPPIHPRTGWSLATPATDGQHVFVATGSGVVAGFDLDGKKQWVHYAGPPVPREGNYNTPFVVDGLVIAHYEYMIAYDAVSGKEVWRTKVPYGEWQRCSTVAVVDSTKLIVTQLGSVVRVKDGRLMATEVFDKNKPDTQIGSPRRFASPLAQGETVYVCDQNVGAMAVKLSLGAQESVTVEKLWANQSQASTKYGPGHIVYEGLLYAINSGGDLLCFDTKDGKLQYRVSPPYEKGKKEKVTYSDLVLAGGRLYVTASNGSTVSVPLGREFKQDEVKTFRLEPTTSTLIFQGKTIFLRAKDALICMEKP